MRKELYISVDIEADGPIPGPYSMSSLGAFVAGARYENGTIERFSVGDEKLKFYSEMKPISDDFIPGAMAVSGLDREQLKLNAPTPEEAMDRFNEWVESIKTRFNTNAIVFAAFPLGFDWMFTYWYLINFSKNGSPFGHSRHIDIKTLYSTKKDILIQRSVKANMDKKVKPNLPHTHNALDDATEQGMLLMNILALD